MTGNDSFKLLPVCMLRDILPTPDLQIVPVTDEIADHIFSR